MTTPLPHIFKVGLVLSLGLGFVTHVDCAPPLTHHRTAASHCARTIVVNKADNMLKLFITGQPPRHWRVATGRYKCTPEGTFRIIEKSVVSRSGNDPLGTRWLGLNTLGRRHRLRVGIHGTDEPQLIGQWASLACIRMRNADVNYLYELVPVGTTVRIVDISDTTSKTSVLPSVTKHNQVTKLDVRHSSVR